MKKLKFLPDPVLFKEEIKKLSNEKKGSKLHDHSFFLSIETNKTFLSKLLINLYKNYEIEEKLLIIGDGELRNYLKRLIQKYKLEKDFPFKL